MNVNDLEKKLQEARDQFSDEISAFYDLEDKESATKADIAECSRQVYYVLGSYKDAIVEYLKANS